MAKTTKRMRRYIRDYCSGCGLCSGICGTKFEYDRGFLKPIDIDEKKISFYEAVCPFVNTRDISGITSFWGDYKQVSLGHASNESVRKNGSSGGVITAIACYMLEERLVDAVIHVGQDMTHPWRTQVYCSTTPAEVVKNAGSRYAQSTPLAGIDGLLLDDKKYAFIGKPCDVRALRNFQQVSIDAARKIGFVLSFFCMGVPSDSANIKLLNTLGVDEEECVSMRYRGDGWPGEVCVIDNNNVEHRMSYNDSWGKILGRDLKKCCKFCIDGIGSFADISCADGWHLTDDNKPDFSERSGRNVIIVRTATGEKVFDDIYASGQIVLEEEKYDIEQLKYIQPSQYARKATMRYKLLAMRLFGKSAPKYNVSHMKLCAKDISLKRKFEIFRGTVRRIIKKEI